MARRVSTPDWYGMPKAPAVGDRYVSPAGVACQLVAVTPDGVTLYYTGGNFAFYARCSWADFAAYAEAAR